MTLSSSFVSNALVRTNSTTGHYIRLLGSLKEIVTHPFGTGIGTAGPAVSKSASLQSVFVPKTLVDEIVNQGIPMSVKNHLWFKKEVYQINEEFHLRFKPQNNQELVAIPALQELSVELKQQVFDLWDRYYHERIPENWHLQMFMEFGWLGGLVYLVWLFSLLKVLQQQAGDFKVNAKAKQIKIILLRGSFLSLLGLVVAGMFLHSFEDSSTSLSLFLLMGLAVDG
jgi:hypothetical protein